MDQREVPQLRSRERRIQMVQRKNNMLSVNKLEKVVLNSESHICASKDRLYMVKGCF